MNRRQFALVKQVLQREIRQKQKWLDRLQVRPGRVPENARQVRDTIRQRIDDLEAALEELEQRIDPDPPRCSKHDRVYCEVC